MQLDYRKRRILQALIDEYINTAEPVGSRSIAKKHELGLSSATIRNEMADLEEMGLLAQPHTSAGRVPSDKGYRLYVDRLMEARDLTIDEIRAVTNDLDLKINELGAVIKNASAIISRLTRYTSVSITPKQEDSEITALEIVRIDQNKACLIVVSKSGTVKNSVASLPSRLTDEDLRLFALVCRKRLCGCSPEQVNAALLDLIREESLPLNIGEPAVTALTDAFLECVGQMRHAEIYLNGTTNIMKFPEFHNIERAREFLEVLEEKRIIAGVLSDLAKDERIKMLIGNENPIDEIKECSVIGATYSAGNIVFGTIGVIGPKRMEYAKVVSIIEYINGVITNEIKRLSDNATTK
jgi:heat-inducible transcriptional repressor